MNRLDNNLTHAPWEAEEPVSLYAEMLEDASVKKGATFSHANFFLCTIKALALKKSHHN